jgi:hypothetical protein
MWFHEKDGRNDYSKEKIRKNEMNEHIDAHKTIEIDEDRS